MAYKKLVINGEEFPLPSKVSDLDNDAGFIAPNDMGQVDISGSTVNIAGGSVTIGKTTYGFSVSGNAIKEVGTPEADTDGANKKYVDDAVKGIDIPDVSVPTKVSQLENDAGYITNFVDEMNVTGTLHTQIIYGHEGIDINSEHTFIGSIDGVGIDFGGYNTDRNYGQIEGDMRVQTPVNDASVANKGYVDGEITVHNTSTTAHNDIRLLISGLTSRLDAVANSDDATLDQLSEIVAYIKANKSLIDSITTSKVNVSDIIDNLTTSVSNKPLSAKMGVELKKLIDAIKIPTTLPASDVYSWAKQPTKPTYTAEEVGAATPAYVDGKLGETIESVKQTTTSTADGGTNVITVTLSDGTKSTFSVKNGSKGSTGDKGDKGDKGDTGATGTSVTVSKVTESTADGGSNVVTFSDGKTLTVKNGSKGSKGDKGDAGADGKIPVKGTDYWTEADKAEIVTAVVAALPKYRAEVE